MSLVTFKTRSIRPNSTAVILGVGSSANPYGFAAGNLIELRGTTGAASGDVRNIYSRLKFTSTASGEAVRAYTEAGAAGVAAGGTVNGIHASLAVLASSSISGQGFGGRFTIDEAADTRTINANVGAILAESNFGAGNTVPATVALIHLKEIGAVTCGKAFRFPTVASAGMLAAHVTDAMTHSIRCVTDAGTVVYLMATTTASNRTGGA